MLDLAGQRFSRLYVIEKEGKDSHGHYFWKCICDCGRVVSKRSNSLKTNNSSSCGCLRREITGGLKKSHGKSSTREYAVWRSMRRRCNNSKDKSYFDYGGRGIKVCSRWNEFSLFLKDMGERPSNKHSIERLDNNKGYEPSNCTWATQSQQAKNRRPMRALNNFSSEDLIKEFIRRGLLQEKSNE